MSATIYDPNDLLVGPIITQLTQVIQEQLPSIQTIYPTPTDSTPDNNSVQFPYEISLDDTQYPGMMRVDLNIYITHLFKRTRLDQVYQQMQPYIYPWLMVLSAWRNQYLVPETGFDTQIIQLDKKARIVPLQANGQAYIGLVFKVLIITEFPVDTNES
jgi:hypothetical protein